MTKGTDHFRTPINQGLEIMRSLIGHTSGLAVPRFAIDLPGGFGKVPLLPEYQAEEAAGQWNFRNYKGQYCSYLDPA